MRDPDPAKPDPLNTDEALPDTDPVKEPAVTCDVVIEHEGWDGAAMQALCAQCLAVLADHDPEAFCSGVIAILFTGDEDVQALNREFRHKDQPTNVLSFPSGDEAFGVVPAADAPPVHIGDIALAYETCYREAADKNIPLKDHAAHLIFHGILHLYGYDHVDDTDAEVMERLETDLLGQLGIEDPYAE